MHPVQTGAYLIARHEVTLADWIAYLDALPAAERERRRPEARGALAESGDLQRGADGWVVTMQPTSTVYRARRGEPLRFPDRDRRAAVAWERLPVFGIDLDDARAYASWLASTGRVRGARLCTEAEWERAARGADGRPFPHGAQVDPDDADIDITYDRKPLAFGPDEVGSHPASNSPFGVADMLGNVWEWVDARSVRSDTLGLLHDIWEWIDAESVAMTRGGGWYQGRVNGLTTNRELTEPTMRQLSTGMRLCADAPPAR
jgi:formylglycine-generating enzyme required for sulfatase activity